MITRENLKDVLENLTEEEVRNAMNENEDYLLIELNVFNAGFVTTIECREYDEEIEMEAARNGDLFIDKDDFMWISAEVGLNWDI